MFHVLTSKFIRDKIADRNSLQISKKITRGHHIRNGMDYFKLYFRMVVFTPSVIEHECQN